MREPVRRLDRGCATDAELFATTLRQPTGGLRARAGQGPSGAGQGAFGGGGRPVATGQVDAYSGGVMTVSDRRTGQSVRVAVTSSTEVTSGFGGGNSTATPVPARIAKGENVTVFGSQAADGSITATRITVLAALQCGRAPRPRGSPSPQG